MRMPWMHVTPEGHARQTVLLLATATASAYKPTGHAMQLGGTETSVTVAKYPAAQPLQKVTAEGDGVAGAQAFEAHAVQIKEEEEEVQRETKKPAVQPMANQSTPHM